MARGDAGSAQALKITINNQSYRDKLNSEILSSKAEWRNGTIEWFSPIEPNYKEFQNSNFWLGILPGSDRNSFWSCLKNAENRKDHAEFWPTRGAHWDAVGILTVNGEATLLLIEAKAQKSEHKGTPSTATSDKSILTINNSLKRSQLFYKSTKSEEWNKDSTYYQMENRLAYLFYLSEICSINTRLVYVYFLNDRHAFDKGINVGSREEWENLIAEEKRHIGLDNEYSKAILDDLMIELFIEAPEY